MAILIKDAPAIEKMRVAGRLAGEVLQMIRPHVKTGVTTNQLDKICHDYIVDVQDAIPAPLNLQVLISFKSIRCWFRIVL